MTSILAWRCLCVILCRFVLKLGAPKMVDFLLVSMKNTPKGGPPKTNTPTYIYIYIYACVLWVLWWYPFHLGNEQNQKGHHPILHGLLFRPSKT